MPVDPNFCTDSDTPVLSSGQQTQSNASIWSQHQSSQTSYQTMQQQQPESHVRSHSGSVSPQQRAQLPQAPPSPYTFPSHNLTSPSASATALAEGGEFDVPNHNQGHYSPSPQTSPNLGALQLGQPSGGEYLVPIGQSQRSRSKSDTSLRPPMWQMGLNVGHQGLGQAMCSNSSITIPQTPQLPTLNAPTGGSPGSSPLIQQPTFQQHFSYGPPASGQDTGTMPNSAQSSGFLSPNSNIGFDASSDIRATDLRRARSETHKRNALSADMTPRFLDPGDALQGGFGSRPGSAASSPYLSAHDDLPRVPGNIGAHRRTFSSGSHGHGHHRSLSRDRATLSSSPYPSPHASPRVNAGDLPDLSDQGGSYRQGRGNGMRSGTPVDPMGIPVHVMGVDANGNPTVQSQAPIIVPRQNVTTHATADASQRRRRTEAAFKCPVPGCGSTFTRHFNLKGML